MGFIIHRAAGEHTLLRQISGDALRIGRDAGAGLRLDDDAVALDHAVVRAEGGGWLVEDRGSVTGTYLNGEPVARAQLAAGDVIEIGGYRLKVQITHPDDPLFVHVAAVGAGAAEAPRAARGSTTGSLRLDELLTRAREAGKPPPIAVTDTGPLHRLAEIAAAAGRPAVPGRRRRERPAVEGTALRRLGEIAAAAAARAEAEAGARAEAAARAAAAAERARAAAPPAPPPAAAPAPPPAMPPPSAAEPETAEVEAPAPPPPTAAEPETVAIEAPSPPAPAVIEPGTARAEVPVEREAAAHRPDVEAGTARIEIPAATGAAPPPVAVSGEAVPGAEKRETGPLAIPAPAPAAPAPPSPAAEPAAVASPVSPAAAAAPRRPERRPPAAAPAAPPVAAGAVAAARIDYAAAYSLVRPGLTKGLLALLATAASAAAVAALAAGVDQTWFMPGISSAHARIVGAALASAPGAEPPGGGPAADAGTPGEGGGAPSAPAPPGAGGPPVDARGAAAPAVLDPRRREIEERGCLACHRPWRGPTAVADGCAGCHPADAAPHAELLVAGSTVPVCAGCHPEHRDRPLVVRGDDTLCLGCHRDLGAVAAAAGASPAVAARVTSFAADHPELVIEIAAADGGVRRLALDDPAARRADPGVLDFDHRVHRVHAAGQPPVEPTPLRGPRGPTTLECGACHRPDERTGRMLPVVFEEHCASCHRLTFDARYPDCQARHGAPAQVQEFLLATYALRRCPDAAVMPAEGAGSIFDRRAGARTRGLPFRSDDPRRRALEAEATEAAVTLFRSACDVCHRMNLDAVPLPTVEPPRLPEAWMPGAEFSHLDHAEFGCGECHAAAAASADTADVLLPGVAACRACHGEDRSAPGWGGLLGCSECHTYHRPLARTQVARR